MLTQPNAATIPDAVIEELIRSVGIEQRMELPVVQHDRYSNDLAEVRFADGRSLMIKRGRYSWVGERFAISSAASRLVRSEAGMIAPAPLSALAPADPPLQAYWRIDKPTLDELWPLLGGAERRSSLFSLGELMSRLHEIRMEGFGPLTDEARRDRSVGAFLRRDLGERLLPAVWSEWPAALPVLERLLAGVDEVDRRVGEASTLVHNDLHIGNVLCDGERIPRCVGLIDLETALAAPAASDLAALQVHHDGLFGLTLHEGWMQTVLEGYAVQIDPWIVAFYRSVHLLNMGFYSAMIGHVEHAERVLEAAEEDCLELDR